MELKVGDAVIFVDEHGREHAALVTSGFYDAEWVKLYGERKPAINLLYVSGDDKRTDSFGRQIERSCSVSHKSNQVAPANYWRHVNE